MTKDAATRQLGPWPRYEHDEIDAVTRVLESGRVNYWTGNENRDFEKEFAELCEARYAIAVANGTVALQLGLQAAGIGPGDEVVVTPRSFIASASCAVLCGATPVFADVDARSQNMTAETVAAVLTPSTRAVIAVHHAGWPCEMDGLMALASEHDLVIIEDCAQAHGARYKGKPVGGIGHIGAFSFCQDKIMTTGGEGGMIVTNDEALWNAAWSFKDHGKSFDAVFHRQHAAGFRWLHESFGSNERMTEMQAAIGRLQIRKLGAWHAARTANAERIGGALAEFSALTVPRAPAHVEHAYYRLYALVDTEALTEGWSRDRIADALNEAGVPAFTGSCPEIYNEKAFDGTPFRPEVPLPTAHALGRQSLAFLVHPTLTAEDIEYMCRTIRNVLSEAHGVSPVASLEPSKVAHTAAVNR